MFRPLQGAQGAVTYTIKDSKQSMRFLIAFSVPWSQRFSKNWYGLKVIDEEQELDQKLYLKMYKKDFFEHSSTNDFAYVSERSEESIVIV